MKEEIPAWESPQGLAGGEASGKKKDDSPLSPQEKKT